MILYRLSQKFSHDSFLQVEVLIRPPKEDFEMKLPEWRPGRYQLGSFSKNLRNFRVYTKTEEPLTFKKTDKNTWKIHCTEEYCVIRYEIYTSKIDGGSTFIDEEHWYLNFINCMIYQPNSMLEAHKVQLDVPTDWAIACGLKKDGKNLIATSFYELVDSPALIGGNLQHLEYKVDQISFNLWFRGNVSLNNKEQILTDFEKFTTIQLETMGEFESDEYHFLFQMPDEKIYHGVEHLNSTCIVLGPAKEFNTEAFYNNFLGISSHELFHYWNIIRIRPEEMWPYDFEKENYFSTGYVAEGVTTYYGDLFLLKSGVKNLKWYIEELNTLFKRHFENYGRFNSSLAESSWDMWLDGYEQGIPHRKVSIYVKGALIALMLDLKIILETEGLKNLDDVMRKLWHNFYKKDKGYSPLGYLQAAQEVLGSDLNEYSEKYITGCVPLEEELSQLLQQFGFEMLSKFHENPLTRHFGLKTNEGIVIAIAPDSPAESVFRMGDKLISFANQSFEQVDNSVSIDTKKVYSFHFIRNHTLKKVEIASGDTSFYDRYTIEANEVLTETEQLMRKKWLNV